MKGIVRGEVLTRPLLLPELFALGSRMENLPLRDYLENPTKVANALRQIRAVLKVDGVMCYCDPLLEAEALGVRVDWGENESRALIAPVGASIEELRKKIEASGGLGKMGRIRVATDVLRRLRTMLKDEPALMVRVTGPYTLAEQLRIKGPDGLTFVAEVVATLVKEYLDAGADVIFLEENGLPQSMDERGAWKIELDPIINVIRFYEALPVLRVDSEDFTSFAGGNWDCALCMSSTRITAGEWSGATPWLGMDLLPGELADVEKALRTLSAIPVSFVSWRDLPRATEMKSLTRVLAGIRDHLACLDTRC